MKKVGGAEDVNLEESLDDDSEDEFEWSNENPTIKQFTFNEDTGLNVEAPNDDNPLFFF